MNIKSKIIKIERDIKKSNKGLINFAVIYMGNPNWREREEEAKREHLAKFGSLDNLQIVRTWVPLPAPPPTDKQLSLVHGTGDNNSNTQ